MLSLIKERPSLCAIKVCVLVAAMCLLLNVNRLTSVPLPSNFKSLSTGIPGKANVNGDTDPFFF